MMRILLAEKDGDLSDILAYGLRRRGYEVVLSPSGQAVLAEVDQTQPDVVVLGVEQRDPESLGALRSLRQTCRTPVILVKADPPAAAQAVVDWSGAVAALPKPFPIRELVAQIEGCRARATGRPADSGRPHRPHRPQQT